MTPRTGLLGKRRRARLGAFGLAIAIVAAPAVAHAVTIDFSTIDSTAASGNIDRIAPATFSHNLYSFDDGFQPYQDRAYNYYGEDGEFIVFDAPVFLTSLDVQFPFPGLPVPTSVTLRMFDAGGGAVGQITLFPDADVQHVELGVSDVSKLLFDTTGGDTTFYGDDGRPHAWYLIDNLTFNEPLPPRSAVPEPAALLLLCAGLALASAARRLEVH